jgi:hypothetical protein
VSAALYPGVVLHNRPGKHKLRYRVFMVAIDLDELTRLNRAFRFLKHNRLALMSIHDRDHGDRVPAPLRPQIEAKLRAGGFDCAGGRIVLLTMPRLCNYAFNPLSVYFCYDRRGELAALVHEVSNTFGERHYYVLAPHPNANGKLTQACEKRFFVSPFLEMDLTYEFEVTPPGERAVVSMIVRRGRNIALAASFSGERRALTDVNLLRAWAANPLMTLMVIAGIHWEALKMWMKGVRYLGRRAVAPRRASLDARLTLSNMDRRRPRRNARTYPI